MSAHTLDAPPSPVQELQFDVHGLTVHALRRPAPGSAPGLAPRAGEAVGPAPRLLCLHGWLDNAASFLPLMPHLPGADIVALDLPGHGASDHLPHAGTAGYDLFETALIVRAALDALDWPRCTLIGHSMGAGIAPLLSVAAPDAVSRLVLIEGIGPLSEASDAWPRRLARALDDRRATGRFTSRTFERPEAAVQARLKAATMAQESARLIVHRQLVERDGGWRWRFDPALRFASPRYQTEAQVRALLAAIRVPVLAIIAEQGFLSHRGDTEARLACLQDVECLVLPGHHHVHMDTPQPVAKALGEFLCPDGAAHAR